MNVHILIPETKPGRADKFAAQLDEKLKTFETDQSRKTFLRALEHNWTRRKQNFEERVRCGLDPRDVVIDDYVLIISEISVIQLRLEI